MLNHRPGGTGNERKRKLNAHDLMSKVKAGELKELHTSAMRGYVSRKGNGVVRAYNGRFGKGYILLTARYDTTSYCYGTYYIEA